MNVESSNKVGQAFLPARIQDAQAGMPAPPFVPRPFISPTFATPIDITHRRLPHWQMDGAIYWVCFRLADSIPMNKLRVWKEELAGWIRFNSEPWGERQWLEYDQRFGERLESWLDAGMGSRALARADVREAVAGCLLRFDSDRLLIHAAVIMPTHVHALLEPLPIKKGEGWADQQGGAGISACPGPKRAGRNACATLPCHELSDLLHGIKGTSARLANKILGTTGEPFWMDESYDHIVRSESQYRHFLRYIRENPVKAALQIDEFWIRLPEDQPAPR
jgi:REP element-mobilizing transposase RayT